MEILQAIKVGSKPLEIISTEDT